MMGFAIRASLQYRANLINSALGSIALQATQLVFISVLLTRFENIAGWSRSEIFLIFSMRLCAHAICTVFFGQHMAVDLMVNEGEFDRSLLRPANVLVQVITRRFHPGAVGDLILGIAVVSVSTRAAPVDWSNAKIVYLLASIVAGGLLEAGIQMILSALTFRTRSMRTLKVTVDNILADFGAYPLTIFGWFGVSLLTFVLPLAFVSFIPATVLLDRTQSTFLPALMSYASPAVGPSLFLLSCFVFVKESKHYRSPGG